MQAAPFTPASIAAAMAAILSVAPVHGDAFYATDTAGDTVTRVNSAGAKSTIVDTGLNTPEQAAFDAAGNLYVADSGLGNVLKFPAGGGAPIVVGNSVPGVISLAFSPSGVLHIASTTDDTVRKLSTDGTTFQTISTLPTAATVRSMVFKKNGEIYVADRTGNLIYRIPEGGGTAEPFSGAGKVTAPFAVAVDSADKLYVTDAAENGRILSFKGNGNGNNTDTLVANLGDVRGLAFDQANVAYCVTGAGELLRVPAKDTVDSPPVATNLGAVQLLTAHTAGISVIAHKGLAVPAVEDAKIGTLASPAIESGQVAFKSVLATSATLPIVNSTNSLALFRSQPDGVLELLARKSSGAPGMPPPAEGQQPPVLNTFADPVMNNTGKVAFVGTLRAGVGGVTSSDAVAVFSDYDGGVLRPVLRRGQSNLGNLLDPAVKLTGFKQMVLPDDAGPAVIATMAGPLVTSSTNLGLFSLNLAGELSLVLRSGAEINAGGKMRKLAGLTIFKPTPLSLGQARHFGDNQTFTLAAKFTDGYKAILRVKAGVPTPEVLVEKGAAVGPLALASFGSPAMADDATFAFRGVLQSAPGLVTTATAPVIVSYDTSNTKVARAGESVPDVAEAFFGSLSDPVVSPSSGIAFFARMKPGFGGVTSATAAGLWQDLGEGVHKVIRQGEGAPGVPKSVRFTAFRQFVLPATGGVVFTATIAGQDISSANNFGVWANDGEGATELLLRKGDKLSIGGSMRTVIAIKIFNPSLGVTGQSRHFDEDGTVACHVKCSDGTQAILALRRP